MARQYRVQGAGLTYHVTIRGNREDPVFADDYDRYRFLGLVAAVVPKFQWTCHAYCLMTTHYHLLLTTKDANIGRGMHVLNGGYAQSFNRRHSVRGHVFGDRYHSQVVEQEGHLLEVFRYIALNPVRAGLCGQPEAWPWSSYAATIGLREPPEFLSTGFLLACFGTSRETSIRSFRAFVTAADVGLRPAA